MITTLENAIQKSMTGSSLSVHHTSLLWALCQEFVLSTTQRKPAVSRAGLPFLRDDAHQALALEQPTGDLRVIGQVEVNAGMLG
jgi:hypothetical protein